MKRKPTGRPPGPAPKGPKRSAQGPKRSAQGPKRSARASAPTPKTGDAASGERLQKVLAHAGIGSRRSCEELILQGRVSVDGKTVKELGTRVNPRQQKVAVDGQPIKAERHVYFAISKPKGYVSTNRDPAGRPRVIDLLPDVPERVFAVGRLDEASVGLMLLTNDGELANKLAHPRFGVEKVYRAIVAGTPSTEALDQLVQGIWLAEGKARAKRARVIGHQGEAAVIELVLAEGKNREVRRVLAKLGHKVMSLTRVAVGPIALKGLKPGQWRHLSAREVDLLRKVADGVPIPTPRMKETGPKPPRRGPRRPDRVAEPPTVAAPAPPPSGPRPPRRAPKRPEGPPTGSGRPTGPTVPARPVGPKPPARPTRRPSLPARSEDAPPTGRKIIGLPSAARGPKRLPPRRPSRPGGGAPPPSKGRRAPGSSPPRGRGPKGGPS